MKEKQSTVKDLYLVLLIIYSGLAIDFFRGPWGIVFVFIVSLLVFHKQLFSIDKKIIVLQGVWLLYFIVSGISVHHFNRFFYITYFSKIFIAWFIVGWYKERLFIKYERILYYLSIVSLFFYAWQNISFSTLSWFMTTFDFGGSFDSKNILVYTLFDTLNNSSRIFPFNCGFCWEPGPFASYILIAIYLNIANRKAIRDQKKHLIILIVTLITTQSTTGYLGLFLIIVWYVYLKLKKKYFVFISPVLLLIITYLFIKVPVLQEKIVPEFQQDVWNVLERASQTGATISLGRFASLQVCWKDFITHPWFGINGGVGLSYLQQFGVDVGAISGIANIMATYGVFGIVVFLYFLIRSGIFFSIKMSYRGSWVFPFLILIISFSFGIVEAPIIFTLWSFSMIASYKNWKTKTLS